MQHIFYWFLFRPCIFSPKKPFVVLIVQKRIKALKRLVWHLSREPIKEKSSLKKQSEMYDEQVHANKAKD